jgi:hypothetical protein
LPSLCGLSSEQRASHYVERLRGSRIDDERLDRALLCRVTLDMFVCACHTHVHSNFDMFIISCRSPLKTCHGLMSAVQSATLSLTDELFPGLADVRQGRRLEGASMGQAVEHYLKFDNATSELPTSLITPQSCRKAPVVW